MPTSSPLAAYVVAVEGSGPMTVHSPSGRARMRSRYVQAAAPRAAPVAAVHETVAEVPLTSAFTPATLPGMVRAEKVPVAEVDEHGVARTEGLDPPVVRLAVGHADRRHERLCGRHDRRRGERRGQAVADPVPVDAGDGLPCQHQVVHAERGAVERRQRRLRGVDDEGALRAPRAELVRAVLDLDTPVVGTGHQRRRAGGRGERGLLEAQSCCSPAAPAPSFHHCSW